MHHSYHALSSKENLPQFQSLSLIDCTNRARHLDWSAMKKLTFGLRWILLMSALTESERLKAAFPECFLSEPWIKPPLEYIEPMADFLVALLQDGSKYRGQHERWFLPLEWLRLTTSALHFGPDAGEQVSEKLVNEFKRVHWIAGERIAYNDSEFIFGGFLSDGLEYEDNIRVATLVPIDVFA